jgi:hypothetical protein
VSKQLKDAAAWTVKTRPELVPFFPLVTSGVVDGPELSLHDVGALALDSRVELSPQGDLLRGVLLHWTSRLPEVTMTRPFSFPDVQLVIDGADTPATHQRLAGLSPMISDVISYCARHGLDAADILASSLRLARAACVDRGVDKAYIAPEGVSEQRMFIQSAEYFPNFPVQYVLRRFKSECNDGDEEPDCSDNSCIDPEVVCFKSKMDRTALTPGVLLASCPHCLVLLGFSLLADPEGVSAVGDILGTRDLSRARRD